jgi:hypothetical protein
MTGIPLGLLIGLTAVAATVRPAAGQVAISGGWNSEILYDIEATSEDVAVADSYGWNMGISYNWNSGIFGFRPGIYYHRIRQIEITAGDSTTSFDLDIVEIPIDIRVRLRIGTVTPYLLAAPVVTFTSTADELTDSELRDAPWKIEFGAGTEIALGVRLWPEVRFGIGMTRLFKEGLDVGGTLVNPRLNTLTVRLGVSF